MGFGSGSRAFAGRCSPSANTQPGPAQSSSTEQEEQEEEAVCERESDIMTIRLCVHSMLLAAESLACVTQASL